MDKIKIVKLKNEGHGHPRHNIIVGDTVLSDMAIGVSASIGSTGTGGFQLTKVILELITDNFEWVDEGNEE